MKLYAVMTQYYPEWKYDQNIESIWSCPVEAAREAKTLVDINDNVWIQAINVDKSYMWDFDYIFDIKRLDKHGNKIK